MSGIASPDETRRMTALEIAEQRHAARTASMIEDIQARWDKRRFDEIFFFTSVERANQKRALAMFDEMTGNLTAFQKAQIIENNLQIEKALGIKKGRPMTIDEADMQNANPNRSKGREYQINCATCTPTYMMRLRGFDVTAGANLTGTQVEYLSSGMHPWEVWQEAKNTPAKYESVNDWLASKKYKQMTTKRWIEFFDEKTADEGVYGFCVGWKGGGGHMTVLQRTADGKLLYIEPQHDNHLTRENIAGLIRSAASKQHSVRGIMRIDDKLFNPKFISILVKK
jgi:hypothetical protein